MKDALITVTGVTLVIAVFFTCVAGLGYGFADIVVERKILRGISFAIASVTIAILLASYLVYQYEQSNKRENDKGPCVKTETRYHKRRPYTVCTERGKWVKTSAPSPSA